MKLPDHISAPWMRGLADDALIAVETKLHAVFAKLERAEKTRLGAKYDFMHAPPELFAAWDRWSRVSTQLRDRGLHTKR